LNASDEIVEKLLLKLVEKIISETRKEKVEAKEAYAGDIITIAGISDIYVGETVAQDESVEAMPPITVDEPTLKMEFLVNNSPFCGRE